MLIVIVFFVIVIGGLGAYFGVSYKKFEEMQKEIEVTFETMDIYLKRRWDIIPKFLELANGYMQQEQETIDKIARLRGRNYSVLDKDTKFEVNYEISSEFYTLIAKADNIQDMKVSVAYQKIKPQIMDIEMEIAKLRRQYNTSVRKFNELIKVFPYSTIAEQMKIKEQRIFEVDEEKRGGIGLI